MCRLEHRKVQLSEFFSVLSDTIYTNELIKSFDLLTIWDIEGSCLFLRCPILIVLLGKSWCLVAGILLKINVPHIKAVLISNAFCWILLLLSLLPHFVTLLLIKTLFEWWLS